MSKYNNDVNALVRDSIRECLYVAKKCIERRKDENENCYGMPALILLCDVIDSVGCYFINGSYEALKSNFKGVGSGTHFDVFYDAFADILNKEINKREFCDSKKSIVIVYRNRSMHNSGLASNYFITTKGEKLYEQNDNDKEYILDIQRLYNIVVTCYEKFEKEHPISKEAFGDEDQLKQLTEPINSNTITGNTVVQ